MKTEIATLESMGACEIVGRDENMNTIQLKRVFKCRHYPDGLINNSKAWLYARGDQQL